MFWDCPEADEGCELQRVSHNARACCNDPACAPAPAPVRAMTVWRLLRTPPADAATNMAVDEALLTRARQSGETVLRVYEWSPPALSLGRNQRAVGCYTAERAARRGVDVVRRLTGGRAVLHAREITYSVTAPVVAGASLHESYARINRVLVEALARIGVEANVAVATQAAPAPSTAPCFETPTDGELVVGGRKLVGSAQWRDEHALLQHGSILVDDDQSLLADLAETPLPPIPGPATLRETLGTAASAPVLFDALAAAVRALEDPCATLLVPEDDLWTEASLLRARYLDAGWTWRR